jgi:hypothetical protein
MGVKKGGQKGQRNTGGMRGYSKKRGKEAVIGM